MLELDSHATRVIDLLEQAGHEAFVVGGYIRDLLMGREGNDIDITTDARPEQVIEICETGGCKVVPTGLKHGTVTVFYDGVPIEVTTYRIDGAYLDNRRPEEVSFTDDIVEDLARRDFTINAIAYNPKTGMVDPFGGRDDIEDGLIVCVGCPMHRFEEDALRILRALRFASQFDFLIEEETAAAMRFSKGLLDSIAAERVGYEIMRLVCGDGVRGVLLDYTDVLAQVLPELVCMKGFEQHNPYHIYDVLEHTGVMMENLAPEPRLRLAALLHDSGKPASFTQEENGRGHFYGHAKVSAEIAHEVMRRLRYPRELCERVELLVARHDTVIEPTVKCVRRNLAKIGPDAFRDLIAMKRADNAAHAPECWPRAEKYDAIEEILEEQIAEQACFKISDLAISGNDLMDRGIEQGPRLGSMLESLLMDVVDGIIPNEREALLARIEELR